MVQVPRGLPRLLPVPTHDGRRAYVFLHQLISHHLSDLFFGMTLEGCWSFRVTRNSELYIDEEEVPNLLRAVEHELDNRKRGTAVRLEVSADCLDDVRADLLANIGLTEDELYVVDGPINPTRLMAIVEGDHSPELRDQPFLGPVAAVLRGREDLFAAIRERDICSTIRTTALTRWFNSWSRQPRTPGCWPSCQTLYRTGGDPRIVGP